LSKYKAGDGPDFSCEMNLETKKFDPAFITIICLKERLDGERKDGLSKLT
jgi:hypothetical protein